MIKLRKGVGFKQCKVCILFFVISLLTILFWYDEHAILYIADEPFVYDGDIYFYRRSYSWLEISGGFLSTPISAFFIAIWYVAFSKIGFPPWMIQASLFLLLNFLQLYSFYLLNCFVLSKLFPEKKEKFQNQIMIGSIIGSLIYSYNTVQMTVIWVDLKGFAFTSAFYPLFLLSMLKIFLEDTAKVKKIKNICVGALSFFISLWGSPKIWIPFIFYTIAILLWILISSEKISKTRNIIGFNVYFFVFLTLILLFTIPFFITIYLSLTSVSPSYTLPRDVGLYVKILLLRTRDVFLFNTFRLWGMNTINEPIFSEEKIMANLINFSNNVLIGLVLCTPTLVILMSPCVHGQKIKKLLPLYVFYIITILGISITRIPLLSNLYLYFYRKYIILSVFNEPWSNFGIFYITLIGFAVSYISFLCFETLCIFTKKCNIKSHTHIFRDIVIEREKFFSLLTLLLLTIYITLIGSFYVYGGFIPENGLFNSKVKVPEEYFQVAKFLDDTNDTNSALILPYYRGKESPDVNHSYFGHSIIPWLTKKDVIATGFYPEENIALRLLSLIQSRLDFKNTELFLSIDDNYISGYIIDNIFFYSPPTDNLTDCGFTFLIQSRGQVNITFYSTKENINENKINITLKHKDTIVGVFNLLFNNTKFSKIVDVDSETYLTIEIVHGPYIKYYSVKKMNSKGKVINLGMKYINLIKLLGVKWVVIRENMRYDEHLGMRMFEYTLFEKIISKYGEMIKDYGKLKLFGLNSCLPTVYVASRAYLARYDSFSNFMNVVGSIDYYEKNYVIVDINNSNLSEYCHEQEIRYNFTRINPTKYKVVFCSVSKPFILILLKNFDIFWNVYILRNHVKVKISEKNHFVVNGFANGWLIDEKGNFTIIIQFDGEMYYSFSKNISLTTFTLCLAIIAIPDRIFYRLTRERQINSYINNNFNEIYQEYNLMRERKIHSF